MGQSQGRIDGQGLPKVQMYRNNERLQNAVDALNSAHVMPQAQTSMKKMLVNVGSARGTCLPRFGWQSARDRSEISSVISIKYARRQQVDIGVTSLTLALMLRSGLLFRPSLETVCLLGMVTGELMLHSELPRQIGDDVGRHERD